ncbi:MAG: nucleotidyltransferase substrate binding protein [Bryobacterales bacterium]|nr:nucleotidyltransferase substrate binding protein [Bryobacterales bacterium]
MIDYSKFRSSLKRLEEQDRNYRRGNPLLSDLDREGIAESVIQRFETCYDCLWKVLKRYLIEELGVADAPNSPKPVFRLAHENGLLAVPVARWLKYADARVGTSHDYDGAKAQACLALVPAFIDDANRLYETMSGELWE